MPTVPSLYSRHVDANHLLFVTEHEFGDGFCQFSLTDTGRTEEQQHAVGFVDDSPSAGLCSAADVARQLIPPLLSDHAFRQIRFDIANRSLVSRKIMSRGIRDSCEMTSMMCSGRTTSASACRFVDLNLDRSRVEPADRFVRQMQIADVLRRHLERGVDRFVGNL